MKPIFIACMLAIFLSSCGIIKPAYKCKPSPGSRDYAIIRSIQKEELVYYVTASLYFNRYHTFFKCLPDSFEVGKKVSIVGWTKI